MPLIDPSAILYGTEETRQGQPDLTGALDLGLGLSYLQEPTLRALWELQTGRSFSKITKSGNYKGWSAAQIAEISTLPSGARNAAAILAGLRRRGLVCSGQAGRELHHWLDPDIIIKLDLLFG